MAKQDAQSSKICFLQDYLTIYKKACSVLNWNAYESVSTNFDLPLTDAQFALYVLAVH